VRITYAGYILVVDDDIDFLTPANKILTAKGFSVVLARSIAEAEKLLGPKPDMIVLRDKGLKETGLDGLAFLTAIQQNLATALIPVIIVFNFMDREKDCEVDAMISKALRAGASSVLVKPRKKIAYTNFISSELLVLINRIFDNQKDGSPTREE